MNEMKSHRHSLLFNFRQMEGHNAAEVSILAVLLETGAVKKDCLNAP